MTWWANQSAQSKKQIVRFLNVKKHKAVKLYQDLPMVLFGLLSGQIAALAYPDAMLWKVVKDASVTGKIQMKKTPIRKIKRGMIVAKGNKTLHARLETALKAYLLTPEFRQTYHKWLATLHDLTSQKAAEWEILTAKHEAEISNLAKTTFLAAASHDVRQQLQALGMFLSVLDDKLTAAPPSKDEAIPVLVERMNDSVFVLNGLFDSLLDISKLESQTLEPEITEFDVGGLMSRLAGQFESQAIAKGLKFKSNITKIKIRCDEALLSQILSNFLGNAIRYTDSGQIDFCAHLDGNLISIEVKDTGIGIPKDKVGKYSITSITWATRIVTERKEWDSVLLSPREQLTCLDWP